MILVRKNYQTVLLPRAVHDLANSSYAGSVIYPALFFAIIYTTAYQYRHPGLTIACLTILATLSIVRIAISYNVVKITPVAWVRWFSVLTILVAGIWSGIWAFVLYLDGLNNTTLLAIVAMTGITSAGIGTLSPLLKLSYTYLFVMVLPMIYVLVQQPDGVGNAYAILVACGTMFLLYVSTRMNAQYWNWKMVNGRFL